MFHNYVLSISHYVLSGLLYMMCKLHDDDDDDESIVKTRTCIVASIVFQEYFLQKNKTNLENHCLKRRRH